MPLDPQVVAILAALKAANVPSFDTLSPVAARELSRQMSKATGPAAEFGDVQDLLIGRDKDIKSRLYRPGPSVRGLVLYFHGGGWVMGNLSSCDATVRAISRRGNMAVLSIDYSLAPEHPFPAAVNEAYEAVSWCEERLNELLGHTTSIVLAGDSAGANLAIATAIALRDEGKAILNSLLLFYPVTGCDFSTESYREFSEGPILTRALMEWFWGHYIPEPAKRLDPRASPILCKNLSNLPPTVIQTAEYDPLRSEGESFAERLVASGVTVKLDRRLGLPHGYASLCNSVDAAAAAVADAIDATSLVLSGAADPETH